MRHKHSCKRFPERPVEWHCSQVVAWREREAVKIFPACPAILPLENGTTLILSQVVREVPGRRLVCRGSWSGRPVYAKLFIGSKASRDAARDVSGVQIMEASGIATPELLCNGIFAPSGHALIFAEVEGESAETFLHSLNTSPTARLELAQKLVETVASHHRAGLIQHDMYLKNFLVSADRILTLDGDGIRHHAAPLGRRDGLDNLALLLSKFDAADDDWVPQLLQRYAAALDMELRPTETLAFPAHVMAHRMRVARGYAERKVFRNCTDVVTKRDWGKFQATARQHDSPGLRQLLASLAEGSPECNGDMLKKGNTCTVFTLPLDGRKVVVKRYNIKSFWHGLSRAWRPSRAAQSWANCYRMRILGIATAEPLALLERRWGWLRRQAYFVTEFVDAPHAAKFFADDKVASERKLRAARNIARLLHKLWRLGLVHGDMKASNILIGDDDMPVLLDLDAMYEARCPRLSRCGHGRDLRRWIQNWRDTPEIAAMMRQALQDVYGDAPSCKIWE